MSMKTEYRGYEIRYAENADEWNCFAIGFSHEKLSKVKAKIDALHLKLRKSAAVDCFVLEGGGYQGESSMTEARVIDYIAPVREKKSWERVGRGPVIDHEVAVVAKFSGSDKPIRRVMKLSSLHNEEALSHVAGINEIERQIASLQKLRGKLEEDLPRLPFERLSDLVKASEHRFEEAASLKEGSEA